MCYRSNVRVIKIMGGRDYAADNIRIHTSTPLFGVIFIFRCRFGRGSPVVNGPSVPESLDPERE